MLESLKRFLTRVASPPPTLDDESGALWMLSLMVGAGMIGLFLYAVQSPFTFFATFTTSVMTAGAALIVGGLIGFLFGIPRTLQNESDVPKPASETAGEQTVPVVYQANTNLEQISDWLTKILVGVGLTQLTNLWTGLQAAAAVLQPGLGDRMAATSMALAILIYFPVCGFLFTYLWTRLFLAGAFRKADLAMIIRKAEEKAIAQVAQTVGPVVSLGTEVLEANPAAIAAAPGVGVTKRRGLWVDDVPGNNASLKQSFEKLQDITFDLSLSTEDALEKVKSAHYSVIISDMSRPPDERACYTLLDRLQSIGDTIPFIIYDNRGNMPANRAEAQQHKAFGMTNSPQELLHLLQLALQRTQ
ncbi:MAG: hypothetical protein U0175_32855 [Caldilineaceae bacterium]